MSRPSRQSLASVLTTRPTSPSVSSGVSDLPSSSFSTGKSRRFSSIYGSTRRATRRGSAMAVLQQGRNDFESSTKSQQVLGLRNEDWNSVQNKVMSLFKGQRLGPGELVLLNDQIRAAIKSDIGAFITEYYKKNLLKRGMGVIFKEVEDDSGQKLLDSLSKIWNKFFIDILPTLRAVFYPVQTKGLSIQQLSLLGFRDHIVLKVNLKEALSKRHLRIPSEIVQLLLHLQSVRDTNIPTEEFLLVETMVAKVVCPYLGTRGLYLGEDEPAVPSQQMDLQPSKNYARRHLGRTFHGREHSPLYRPLYHPC
ncbi:proline-rich protein 5-like [Amphiura filiformis]|uniref:proline-rich protein 5-like n=1 Tax=Amphiura filiformis TaxID=82378 RepID=UPI003B227937